MVSINVHSKQLSSIKTQSYRNWLQNTHEDLRATVDKQKQTNMMKRTEKTHVLRARTSCAARNKCETCLVRYPGELARIISFCTKTDCVQLFFRALSFFFFPTHTHAHRRHQVCVTVLNLTNQTSTSVRYRS